jgi:hypothetical protein
VGESLYPGKPRYALSRSKHVLSPETRSKPGTWLSTHRAYPADPASGAGHAMLINMAKPYTPSAKKTLISHVLISQESQTRSGLAKQAKPGCLSNPLRKRISSVLISFFLAPHRGLSSSFAKAAFRNRLAYQLPKLSSRSGLAAYHYHASSLSSPWLSRFVPAKKPSKEAAFGGMLFSGLAESLILSGIDKPCAHGCLRLSRINENGSHPNLPTCEAALSQTRSRVPQGHGLEGVQGRLWVRVSRSFQRMQNERPLPSGFQRMARLCSAPSAAGSLRRIYRAYVRRRGGSPNFLQIFPKTRLRNPPPTTRSHTRTCNPSRLLSTSAPLLVRSFSTFILWLPARRALPSFTTSSASRRAGSHHFRRCLA